MAIILGAVPSIIPISREEFLITSNLRFL